LEKLGQLLVKQLKNRYADPSIHKRFVVGVDRSKMRLYDVDMSAQKNIMQEPIESNISKKYFSATSPNDKKMDFSGIKF